MNKQIEIVWPEWKAIINENFIPLIENRSRYLILWGGRGSGKSNFVAKKLVYRALTEPYFKCILVRETFNSIRETSYQTLKDVIHELGLEELFEFKVSPLEITCTNGNSFICRGLEDVVRLKSISDPSCIWIEEDIPSESDWTTLTTSLRTLKAEYIQEIWSLNPETEENYQTNWFYKRFFEGRSDLSYSDIVKVELAKDIFVDLSFTVHHSTYKDNRWIPQQYAAALEDLKRTDPYKYQVFTLGRWGQKDRGTMAYKQFSMSRNVAPVSYDPTLPLWVSFDFNVLPGVSCLVSQCHGKELHIIKNIQLTPPHNNTRAVCAEIARTYPGHIGGLFVTGDPSGIQRDTVNEQGVNNYSLILGQLKQFKPSLRVSKSAPPVVARMNFINSIFDYSFNEVKIIVGEKCDHLISDLLNGQEAADGTKLKEKMKDPRTGATIEKYHHFTDSLDYLVLTLFITDFHKYLLGGRMPTPPKLGKNPPSKNDYNYVAPARTISNPKLSPRKSKNSYQ